MEALADMMDRALLPENGGNSEGAKAIFRQITAAARAQMEQIKQARERIPRGTKQTLRNGAIHDNG